MKIEHIGFQVGDPAAMAEWYVKNLGFSIKRSSDEPVPVRFIGDGSGKVMLEVYKNPKVDVPDYPSIDPLTFHIAYECGDISRVTEKLIRAGATLVSPLENLPNGDQIAILRDPWGIVIQLCNRKNPMV
ncbi:MAG TPA: glyoxalase/bleomycin resistance/dioxygenase family protein [Lentisphaeria bacterium]|nr:MAG: hypothetical protein A2X48_08030 [Lentisphaerae bacterium GWF2_49_21]HBC85865.1 glyoxalase/bleomycin resistance/dioxygenase family protein [Lentisphaeria bacterium]